MQQATKCRGGRYLENHGPQLQVKVLHRVTVSQQADALHVEPVNRKKTNKIKILIKFHFLGRKFCRIRLAVEYTSTNSFWTRHKFPAFKSPAANAI